MLELLAVNSTVIRRLTLVILVIAGFSKPGDLLAQGNLFDITTMFAHNVPLIQTAAGSLSVTGTLGGIETEFLLDTGASMVTVSASLFNQIRSHDSVVKVRRVGARLASGKVEALDVYRIERFTLGNNCELGPVEVAVLQRGTRNLLGMNALQQAAPFAISTSPPSLGLSHCVFSSQQVSLRE